MRKHDVRKWLHAILDLLPVILIPVFMIYSHRHDIGGSSVTIDNQIYERVDNLFYTKSSKTSNNITLTKDSEYVTLNGAIDNQYISTGINLESGHTYSIYASGVSEDNPTAILGIQYQLSLFIPNGTWISILDNPQTFTYDNYSLFLRFRTNDSSSAYVTLIDTTEMSSVAIERSSSTDLRTGINNIVVGGEVLTYNDTDIMSQFTYCFYNAINKYFNFGNVFNLVNVYQWFNANIFGGTAPFMLSAVWNIVLYEFVMDLLFLLYGLFMWFIDMIEKLMEKPINSVR